MVESDEIDIENVTFFEIYIYNLAIFSIFLSNIHHVRIWLSVALLLGLEHKQLHTCGDDDLFTSLVTLKHYFFVWVV